MDPAAPKGNKENLGKDGPDAENVPANQNVEVQENGRAEKDEKQPDREARAPPKKRNSFRSNGEKLPVDVEKNGTPASSDEGDGGPDGPPEPKPSKGRRQKPRKPKKRVAEGPGPMIGLGGAAPSNDPGGAGPSIVLGAAGPSDGLGGAGPSNALGAAAVASNVGDDALQPQYHPGDLIWSKVGQQQFWPSMVIVHPGKKFYYKQKRKQLIYYVQYFGIDALHGWTQSTKRVVPYRGVAEFEAYAEEKQKRAKGKSQRKLEATFYNLKVKRNEHKERSWIQALGEIEEAASIQPTSERYKQLVFHFYDNTKRKKAKYTPLTVDDRKNMRFPSSSSSDASEAAGDEPQKAPPQRARTKADKRAEAERKTKTEKRVKAERKAKADRMA